MASPELAKAGWRPGAARPLGALPLDDRQAQFAIAMAILGPLVAAVFLGESWGMPREAYEITRAVGSWGWLLIPPWVEAIACLISRRPSGLSASLAFDAARASLMAQGARLCAGLCGISGWSIRALTRWTMPKAWSERARAAPMRWCDAFSAYGELRSSQAELLQETAVETLTEVGAWRLARRALKEGDGALAARVWLARPFNPSWRVGHTRLRSMSSSAKLKPGASFSRAIEFAASVECDASKERYLRQASGLMRSAEEGLQIGAEIAEPGAARKAPRRL